MKQNRLQHEKEYVEFIKKRLASNHFIENSTPEEIEKTNQKLKKARLVLKILQAKKVKE